MNRALDLIATYQTSKTVHGYSRYQLAIIRATYGQIAARLAREANEIKTIGLRRAVQDMIASAIINADDTMADGSVSEWEIDSVANPWESIFLGSLDTGCAGCPWRQRAYAWFHTRKVM